MIQWVKSSFIKTSLKTKVSDQTLAKVKLNSSAVSWEFPVLIEYRLVLSRSPVLIASEMIEIRLFVIIISQVIIIYYYNYHCCCCCCIKV